MGVLHIPSQTWLDFGTAGGTQSLEWGFGFPNGLDVAKDGSLAIVTGSGWAIRVDFDYATPTNTTITQFLPGQLSGLRSPRLSPSSNRVAMLSNQDLVILSASSGALLHTISLAPGTNL